MVLTSVGIYSQRESRKTLSIILAYHSCKIFLVKYSASLFYVTKHLKRDIFNSGDKRKGLSFSFKEYDDF